MSKYEKPLTFCSNLIHSQTKGASRARVYIQTPLVRPATEQAHMTQRVVSKPNPESASKPNATQSATRATLKQPIRSI